MYSTFNLSFSLEIYSRLKNRVSNVINEFNVEINPAHVDNSMIVIMCFPKEFLMRFKF